MENQEVVDFIEAYRNSCLKGSSLRVAEKVKPETCTVAQLLCEEARTRWLSIVEEEDVLIDDISCVVVELKEANLHLVQPPCRSQAPNLDAGDLPGREAASIPTSLVRVRDPRRNSVSDEPPVALPAPR